MSEQEEENGEPDYKKAFYRERRIVQEKDEQIKQLTNSLNDLIKDCEIFTSRVAKSLSRFMEENERND